MISKELILKAISWKKSPEITAKRLGISVKEYFEYKKRYLIKDNISYIDNEKIEERVVEFDEDVKQGTGHIKALTFTEPRSPEDIEKITGKLSIVTKNDTSPNSPGMLSRHYAPKTNTYLTNDVLAFLNNCKEKRRR
jgi:hypothetical protein